MDKLELFGADWANSAASNLQLSQGYKNAASAWEGAMVFMLQADPSLGIPEAKSVFFDLWHGECRAARIASGTDLEAAQYIIVADAFTWQQVLNSQLEPIAGLLRGKLKLKKGNMAVLARFVIAAKEMVKCAADVPTLFPTQS